MNVEFVAVVFALSIAFIVVSSVAYALGIRWLQQRANEQASLHVLAELDRKIEEGIAARKAMAEDWKRKFNQLEGDWKKLKEHADAQFSGAVAQVASTSRGFR